MKFFKKLQILLAFILGVFTFIRAKEEFSVEQLNSDDSKDELEQYVNNQDVDDVF
jgi:hypothetical protein